MNAAPEPNAARPARRAAGRSRRPTAHPTRTEPAFPKPMATVKVRLAMERASWCAASGRAPKRAARNPTSAKIPTSAPMCRPTGSPTASAARSARGSGARERRPGGRGTPPTASASSAAWRQRAEARRDRRAGRAERRDRAERAGERGEARAAEHEQEIGGDVEHVRDHRRDDHGPGEPVRLQIGAAGEVEQEEREPGEPPQEVPAGLARDVCADPERLERGGGEREGEGERGGEREGEPGALPQEAARARRVPGAERLRDERIEAVHHPHAEHRERHEQRVAEADPRERQRPRAPDDRGVHDAHERLAALRDRERHGQTYERGDLRAEGGGAGGHGAGNIPEGGQGRRRVAHPVASPRGSRLKSP